MFSLHPVFIVLFHLLIITEDHRESSALKAWTIVPSLGTVTALRTEHRILKGLEFFLKNSVLRGEVCVWGAEL